MHPLEDMGRFKTVVIDPPWEFKTSDYISVRKGCPYDTMSVSEIIALAVPDVVDIDANVFLWTIQRLLPESFDILKHWGLHYRFTMVWHKTAGTQFYDGPASNAEFIIVGGNGKANWQSIKAFNLVNHWPRGTHSAKPEGFYDLLRRVTPAPRLDVFGRRRIAGFQSWGDEAPEGEALPDHYQQVLM